MKNLLFLILILFGLGGLYVVMGGLDSQKIPTTPNKDRQSMSPNTSMELANQWSSLWPSLTKISRGPEEIGILTKTGVVSPVDPETAGLAPYPDEPFPSIPAEPTLSIKFLVEHRTALNGKTVTIQGFVVYALLGEDACPGGGIGACAQPRIFLADTTDQGRNKDYDVMILLGEKDNYNIGQHVIVTGVVSSSKVAVYLTKDLKTTSCLGAPKGSKITGFLFFLTDPECAKIAQSNPLLKQAVHGNKVQVYILVADTNFVLEPQLGSEELRSGDIIQASVYMDKLSSLASDPRIRNIRLPDYGVNN